jgi:hypothetical protein
MPGSVAPPSPGLRQAPWRWRSGRSSHFNRFGRKWVPSAVQTAPASGLVLLGLDERSAAVWDGAGWSAAGPGAVTVIREGATDVFHGGDRVAGIPTPGAG